MERDLNKLLNEIKNLVLEAGKIIINADYDALNVELKEGNNNIVTKYDNILQAMLKEHLLKLLPEATFIGEEKDDEIYQESEYVFIVDPIDGTTNFSRKLNMSSISVALLHHNEVIIGVCYNPYSNEMYEAIKGQGAYLNNQKIHVSDKKLNEGIILCGCAPYYDNLRNQSLEIQKKLALIASDYRRFGSAVLEICSIASGKAEGYFELKLMPWDYAAASLILKEAGGTITTITGDTIGYSGPTSVLATNGVEDYLQYLK